MVLIMNNSYLSRVNSGFGAVPLSWGQEKESLPDCCLKIAKCAAVVFAAMLIGTLAGGPLGCLVGCAAATGVLLAGLAVKHIWILTCKKSFKLPDEILRSIPQSGPRLGESSSADLLLINKVEDGFEWKKKLVQSAESSIEISANYAGGKVFTEFLGLIEQRMKEKPNLKVHVICAQELLDEDNRKLLDRLAENPHFNVLITSAQLDLHNGVSLGENHVKLIVVDEKYFMMGGSSLTDQMNRSSVPSGTPSSIAELLIPKAFCDSDVAGKGEVAKTMRSEFFKLYSLWEQKMTGATTAHYFPIAGSQGNVPGLDNHARLFKQKKVKFFVGGPEHGENNPISREYVRLIQSAEKTIRLANSQFNPAEEILEALQKKKEQRIKIIGQYNHSAMKVILVLPSRSNYKYLDKVYEYDKPDTLYHKKIMIIDDKKTVIGSYNLSQKSAHFDHEIALEIEDEEFTHKVIKKLDKDILCSVEYPQKDKLVQKIEALFGSVLGFFVYNFT